MARMRPHRALRQAAGRGTTRRRPPMSLERAASEFGRTRPEQNRGLADYFGVSTRTVQRWRTEGAERRAPGAGRMRRMRTAAGRRAGARRRQQAREGGATVSLGGRIQVSRDVRDRNISGLTVSPEAMSDVLDLLEAGDDEGAADRLMEALGEENGFGDVLGLEEVEFLDIEPVGEEGEEEGEEE
jgi:hypothetical protein